MKKTAKVQTVRNIKYDDNCIFCKIVKGELPSTKVYEDATVLVFRDISGDFPDHLLVVPKEHYLSMLYAPCKVVSKVMTVAKHIAKDFVKNGKYEGANIVTNCGKAAGQSIDHFHVHIIPRKDGDKPVGII